MKIIDDFLPNHQFNQLESGMMDWRFPWYYTDKIVNEGEDLFQFIHIYPRIINVWGSYIFEIIEIIFSSIFISLYFA